MKTTIAVIRFTLCSGTSWGGQRDQITSTTPYKELSQRIAWMTWDDVSKVLSGIQFQNPVEELFKKEVIDYIRRKIRLFKESKVKGLGSSRTRSYK
jgi:hypothetical protein